MKVSIGEDQFRAESRKLAIHLADPEVEVFFILCFIFVALITMLQNVHLPTLFSAQLNYNGGYNVFVRTICASFGYRFSGKD